MKQTKWFDRTFDFSFKENIFPTIIERLKQTPLLLKNEIEEISEKQLNFKPNNNWSIKENIGHLTDLEPIWQGRLEDILNNESVFRVADLENKKTNLANHNKKDIDELLKEFVTIRTLTIHQLNLLSEKEIYKYALHPRLKTPMRILDLFFFVAEHDDHHLTKIINFKVTINSK
jgi:uncharacterized damage-inducible protein DinB